MVGVIEKHKGEESTYHRGLLPAFLWVSSALHLRLEGVKSLARGSVGPIVWQLEKIVSNKAC